MAAAGISQPAAPGSQAKDDHDQRVQRFHEFLHENREAWEAKIDSQLANGNYRMPLELRDLHKHKAGLDKEVMNEPAKFLRAWEEALLVFLKETKEKAFKDLKQPLKLDIKGSFGRNHQTPRGLRSTTLRQLMCVEGIVTKAGMSAPRILTSMHVRQDKDDGYVLPRDHRDATSFVDQASSGANPSHDSEGNALQIEVGLSVYKDEQHFYLTEAFEQAPRGQLPRSVEVVCEGDLTEKVKPGDRVQVTGVYRSFPPQLQDFTDGIWESRLIATNITPIKELLETPFVPDDVKHIKQIAARADAFELLGRSFVPSICGHEKVKRGLLLMMIGGTEKATANGVHLRGDINVLLIGDPSCGKSQMLRFVMSTAPNPVSTTGRGSSGPGLTAAMIRDAKTKEFQIEAGAMVLADRGVICIDEFDKMGMNDRVAIHEAMEQQVVTISKAGQNVTLNARCSVLAAANPVYGSFDPSMDVAKNIGMPDSILSRFDLIFIVRDLTTEEIDRKIATQVLQQASQRLPGMRRGAESMHHSTIVERQEEVDRSRVHEACPVFQQKPPGPDGEPAQEGLTVDFVRKYIRFCKSDRYKPVLSQEAQTLVSEKYVDMRMRFQSGFADLNSPDGADQKPRLAVTVRTLEALIRLATAHAKLKLRKKHVLVEDVEVAYRLMLSAREEEVPEPEAPLDAMMPEDDDDDGADGPGAPTPADAERRGRRRTREEAEEGAGEIASTRLTALTTLLARTFAGQGLQQMQRADLHESLNAGLAEGEQPFGDEEFGAGLDKLEEQNKVMVDENGLVILMA